MVATAGIVDIDIGLDLKRFKRQLAQARRELQRFERHLKQGVGGEGSGSVDRLNQSARRASRTFVGLAGNIQLVATALGALALYGGTRAFATFEATLNSVQAVSSANASQFALLSEKAKELGATTKFTASDVAGAMKFMAMAGLEASEIYGGVEQSLVLAAAGGMDLAQSADIVTNIMTAMGLSTSELGRAVDVLTDTFTSSNTSLSDLGFAFKFVAPIAAAAGIQFEEVSAALGLLGNAGMQGTIAGTALRGAIIRLANPTKEAQKLMDSLSINVKNADGSFKSLTEIVRQFEPHAKNVQLFAEVFGQRAGPGMVNIVRQGSTELARFTAQLERAQGRAKAIAEVQMRGLMGAFLELKSAAEGLAISIGESGLGRAFESLTRSATDAFRIIDQWVKATASLSSQGVSTLTEQASQLNEQLQRIDKQIVGASNAGAVARFLGSDERTISFLKEQRKEVEAQLDNINEFIRLQRQLAETGRTFRTGVEQVDIEDDGGFPSGFGDFDDTAAKRTAAVQQLQALESEYLRSTQQNRQLIEVEYQRELDRFKMLLDQKLISQQEYEAAREQLTILTAQRMQELENESLRVFQSIGQSVSSSLESAFREFVETGKLDFKEFTRSILADIATIIFRMQVLQPLFGGGGFGGTSSFASAVASFFHGGGIVGSSGSRKMISPSMFLGAPRLHNGGMFLRSDERPAILQTGERVLRRGESNDNGIVIQIVNNMSNANVRQEQGRTPDGRELRRFIVEEMNSAIAEGRTDNALRGRFGNRVQQVRR